MRQTIRSFRIINSMNQRTKKWLKFTLRWGIAAAGIWYVFHNMWFRDHVLAMLEGSNRPVDVALAEPAGDNAEMFKVRHPDGTIVTLNRDQILNRPVQNKETIRTRDGKSVYILGLDLSGKDLRQVNRLLVSDTLKGEGRWITPREVIGGYQPAVPRPRVEQGLVSMVRQADASYLWAAVFIFPITFLITSYRWNELLKALDIFIGQSRAFVLSMVGAFYNTFMPGSTGGDLLKAYYVAKQTPHRTRAVLSVLIDRVIGLLALVILGGVMAAYQYHIPACRKVALGCAAILAGVIFTLFIYYNPLLRRITGLDFLLSRLPMQRQVQKAREAMEIYRRHPLVPLWALIVTFPVHITVTVSAMLAGMAFDLPLTPLYYWAAVPVIVLVGAIPISPQGAGVMEIFAVQLIKNQGGTLSHAVALTMSIRFVQIFWNLIGGIFVLRGKLSAPPGEWSAAEDVAADESLATSNQPLTTKN